MTKFLLGSARLTLVSLAFVSPVAAETTDWLGRVQADIAASEYEIRPLQDGWQAANRAQDLRTSFAESGIRVVPRSEREPAWSWTLSWVAYGRGPLSGAVPDATIEATGARITYRRGALTEWYENSPRGLKQGFVLTRPPEEIEETGAVAEGPVRLDLEMAGDLRPILSEDRLAFDFESPGGERVLRFAELRVFDANERTLPAWFEGFADAGIRGLRIVIDDEDASYPIVVDPLATSPVWTAEADQASAQFGYAVATAGDVNGDGFSDVIVGAPNYDNGQTDEGRVFLYFGSASGPLTGAGWTTEGNQASALYGRSVATAGDVNGDGYSDVIVGAPNYDNGSTDEGRAFVFLGASGKMSTTPAWTGEVNQAGARFGNSVGCAGDVNRDGYSDVVVGARQYNTDLQDEGAAFLYLGTAGGPASAWSWSAEGDQTQANFGCSVAGAGDVNGDGYSDVIAGADQVDNGNTDEGQARLYLGSATGLNASPAWIAESNQTSAFFGNAVATAGDVNGDGYADVIVGARMYDNGQADEGRAFVYLGSSSGLGSASWTAESDQASAHFGFDVATAGDVNGDGYADVLVGADGYDDGTTDAGRVSLYLGSASGLAATPTWNATGGQAYALFGISVATAGDANGDGYSDVLVGASGFDNGESGEGRAFVYLGSPSASLRNVWSRFSDRSLAHLGYSVAGIGDVNGDDLGDIAVGAPWYDNGWGSDGAVFVYHGNAYGSFSQTPSWRAQGEEYEAYLGQSVAGAGDVNGDGYGDLVVGSPFYGALQRGRVLVFHGSSSGLDQVSARPVGSPSNADWRLDGQNQLGYAVAGAGDVNGDGYADIVATRPANTASVHPTAFVYYGSRYGITHGGAFPTHFIGTAERYGWAVGSAGDVNGDGYSDVIVGAPNTGYISLGAAYLYLGSKAGLGGGYAWRADGVGNYGQLGWSVGTAGDVNGDGYSDVVIGAPGYEGGGTDGAQGAFAWYGSATGLGANGNPSNADWHVTDGSLTSGFAHSIATAGDVNGDGYSDVVVGIPFSDEFATDAGQIRVYLGSPTGLSTTVGWFAFPVNANGSPQLGRSVASAGDVNGDGYADVIAGSPFEDGGSGADYGRAYLWLGNDTPTASRTTSPRPRQEKEYVAQPIGAMGKTDGYGHRFKILLTARSPFGRGGVKLQWEVKPLGSPLNGTGLQAATAWSNALGGTRGFQFADTSLTVRDHHWRVRVLYQAATTPFLGHGRWITVPTNGWQETDLRSFGCEDADGDGYGSGSSEDCLHTDGTDCSDVDAASWAIPGEASTLTLGADRQTLTWSAPGFLGGSAVQYDSIRSSTRSDFTTAATCVESNDGANLTSVDAAVPEVGGVFHYLVRAGNSCGEGSLGTASSGAQRAARTCP